jgi:hypothetical protein
VYVFAGPDAWAKASRRREVHGPGSALVLPPDAEPADILWPALDGVFVDARAVKRQKAVSLGACIIACGTRYAAVLAIGDEPLSFRSAE